MNLSKKLRSQIKKSSFSQKEVINISSWYAKGGMIPVFWRRLDNEVIENVTDEIIKNKNEKKYKKKAKHKTDYLKEYYKDNLNE